MTRFDLLRPLCLFVLLLCVQAEQLARASLIIAKHHGGESALPYYRALNLQPRTDGSAAAGLSAPKTPDKHFSEGDFLPVHSERLSVGSVTPRVIDAPGLTPFFLMGDDEISRAWLKRHLEILNGLHAVGFVVEVQTASRLKALRALAPMLTLEPATADDLVQRLKLAHYPVLVTATGIE